VFEDRQQKSSRKEERLEGELSCCKDVIAEITAENLELKKRSRNRQVALWRP
jgi:hypothetical protein